MAAVAGISVKKSNKYSPQLWFAWSLLLVGVGLLSSITAESSIARMVGYEVVFSTGFGILYSSTYYPALAPLPVSANAKAVSLFMFVRYFAQVWGITIGGTILQNGLSKRLPAEFLSDFPQGVQVAYSIISLIGALQDPFKKQVQDAFAASLQDMWRVMIAFTGFGLLISFLMKSIPLHTSVDREWGLQDSEKK